MVLDLQNRRAGESMITVIQLFVHLFLFTSTDNQE